MTRYDDDENGYPPYVPVAKRRQLAAKMVAKLKKKDTKLSPVAVGTSPKLVTAFWGKAWVRAIEDYRDYDYRVERGRSYLRNGAVIDLRIAKQKVQAQVLGTELYQVEVTFKALKAALWKGFIKASSGEIASLVDLLSGKLPAKVTELIADKRFGLFPAVNEISFCCTCLDDASLCKHVAATLYGVGVRFDADPRLFFQLRGVDPADLVTKAKQGLARKNKKPATELENLGQIFDIEFDQSQL